MLVKTPLRVAIVNETADPRRGGAETSIREMAQELARLGVAVTLVYSGDAPAAAPTEPNPIGQYPIAPRGGSRRARTANFITSAVELCRAKRFDIVHAVTPMPIADVYQPRGGTYRETIARSNALAGGSLRGLLSRLGRRLNRKQQYLLRVEREMLSAASPPMVAAVSEYGARQVRDGYHVSAERVRVVFNGVNLAEPDESARQAARVRFRSAAHVPPDAPLVLFVAHNFKLKGLRELLLAAARRSGCTWSLAVIGRDDARPYQRLGARLGITSRVHFAGAAETSEWFAAADMLAHPTWYDPCSRVVLEAAGCGLPVVTTRYNGAAEVLENGRTGVVIDEPADVDALADGIERCLSPELTAAARDAAGELRQRVSMARHARELVSLYEEIRQSGKSPRRTAR